MHVWRSDLTAPGDELGELLSPDEWARAERFVRERDRELWTRARGLLRELLGRYLECDPRALAFTAGEHGKPALSDARLSFNLSHSGHLALYAFSSIAVGVDVEIARRPVDELAIAERTFGPAEARRLAALDPATRRQEFLRAWVRHEAQLKCLGVGIGGADALVGRRRPWTAELAMGRRAAAAVAIAMPQAPSEISCWDWPAAAGAPAG